MALKTQTQLALHEERITRLEKNSEEFNKKMDTVLQDKLPGIEKAIASLSTKINVMSAINIGAIIIGLIASKII